MKLQFPDNTRNKTDMTQLLCICHFICVKNTSYSRIILWGSYDYFFEETVFEMKEKKNEKNK